MNRCIIYVYVCKQKRGIMKNKELKSWAENEFSTIDLKDSRLNKRLKIIGQKLFENPMSSINHACAAWDTTKAAYRLFDNDKVQTSSILEAHREATMSRLKEHSEVLVLQDTTFFNYDNHTQKEGLGLIHSNKFQVKGLLAHNTLLLGTDGVPLGLFDQRIYARQNKQKRSKSYAPIEEKESGRWIESVKTIASKAPTEIDYTIIGDREADIFELMQICSKYGYNFVIRSTHNRVVGEKQKRWGCKKNANQYLKSYLVKKRVKTKIVLEVKNKNDNKKRKAHLNLRFCKVKLPAPWRIDWSVKGTRDVVDVFILEVKEHHPPKGCERVHWRLLTSKNIFNVYMALKVLQLYAHRWSIEVYHKVLKSGCYAEKCRLAKFSRLERYLTLISIVGWRLFWMTKISQKYPDKPCSLIFSKNEWVPLYRVANNTTKLPIKCPTARNAIHYLAMLGGFMNRKSDNDPGIVSIWRGWKTLNAYLNIATYG